MVEGGKGAWGGNVGCGGGINKWAVSGGNGACSW